MTTTRAAAEAAVRAVRYPPLEERFWGPFYAPPRWDLSTREYLDCADEEMLAIGTIEHIDAIKSISEIVSTPGLDLALSELAIWQRQWSSKGKLIMQR
jgi:4-hydroxy-2-oxoheptanedioate aldolase